VRLSERYRRIIRETAERIFGAGTEVYLFGSRVDDTRRGGDIDLYIVPGEKTELFEKKSRFLAQLWSLIGEQKIDVIIAKDPERPIEKIARKEGIRL